MRWHAPLVVTILFSIGCAHEMDRFQVMSAQLPLSVRDFEEIRAGDEAHGKVLESQKLLDNPDLEAYVHSIGMRVVRVSDRPHLPYRFFVLDSDEVDVFGQAGGRVYITRGAFNFIESESELAAVLAHEIGHISAYRYAPDVDKYGKLKKAYNLLVKASDQAHGFAGPMGAAGHKGLTTVGKVTPMVRKRFNKDAEMQADNLALKYLIRAGYDPRALSYFVDKLSKVPPAEVGQFVDLLNSHPPFKNRRKVLQRRVKGINYKELKLRAPFGDFAKPMVSKPPLQTELGASIGHASAGKTEAAVARAVPIPAQ